MTASSQENPAKSAPDIIDRAALTQRKDTAKAMARPSLAETLKMARRALSRADRTIKKVVKQVPPPSPIQCRAGCPWCCHIRVTASPPEILLILDFINEKLDAEDKAALRHKVTNIDHFTRGRDGDTRARLRLPCPLLRDSSCSVHPVRPLSCRGVVSTDAVACIRSYESLMETPVPQHKYQYDAANRVGYGLHAGPLDAGFGLEDVELNAGLAIGLDDARIGERWLRGEEVFAPAAWVTQSA